MSIRRSKVIEIDLEDEDVKSELIGGEDRPSSPPSQKEFLLLDVPPMELAKQITLIDVKIFKNIKREELENCAWSKKDKFDKAPNVVELTRRFNRLSFWITREILEAPSASTRTATLTYAIKLAKKLNELNNMHSMLAVMSSLQSAPIFRLARTWQSLRSKETEQFEKMKEFLSSDENHKALREHLATTKYPCIPYLGLYQNDLTFLDSADKSCDPDQEKVMKVIAELLAFQASEYSHEEVPHVRDHLLALPFKEDLQRMLDDENYRLSLQIEPRQETLKKSGAPASGPPGSPLEPPSPSFASKLLQLAPTMTLPGRMNAGMKKGHRKSHSLGNASSLFGHNRDKEGLIEREASPNHTVLRSDHDKGIEKERHSFANPFHEPSFFPSESPSPDRMLHKEENRKDSGHDLMSKHSWIAVSEVEEGEEGDGPECEPFPEFHLLPNEKILIEGILKRKTSSMPMKQYHRQWVVVTSRAIYFFKSKHNHRLDREGFKASPCVSYPMESVHVALHHSQTSLPSVSTPSPHGHPSISSITPTSPSPPTPMSPPTAPLPTSSSSKHFDFALKISKAGVTIKLHAESSEQRDLWVHTIELARRAIDPPYQALRSSFV